MTEITCDVCGKVYNALTGDHFWAGRFDVPGFDEVFTSLCDDCHQELIRDQ